MSSNFKPIHGFNLSVADPNVAHGMPVLTVFPEIVLSLKDEPGGGSIISVRSATGEIITLRVKESSGAIRVMMNRCKELDQARRLD